MVLPPLVVEVSTDVCVHAVDISACYELSWCNIRSARMESEVSSRINRLHIERSFLRLNTEKSLGLINTQSNEFQAALLH